MKEQWWHGKVAYQIYPKSFQDSNGDGIGDLRGIINRLDYLAYLGVDIVWISPIFVSPFVDQGYDIADYKNIAPVFGSMEDFDELLAKAKSLNIEIILDLVINHCSSEHPWFKKALANPDSEEGSYFYFRKGKDGKAPDNLRSYFGGSVWEKVPGFDDLYYLHYFAKEQPDLNWFNDKLRFMLFDMINWWLDKGIAGFRIDAIMNIQKDLTFPGLEPDAPDGMAHANKMSNKLAPLCGKFLHEMNEKTFRAHDAFSVGEAFGVPANEIPNYVGDNGYFSSIFDFSVREYIEKEPHYITFPKVDVKKWRDLVFAAQERANGIGFLAPIIENHDEPRGVSYFLPKRWQNESGAKSLGMVNIMLRGIPFIYQGQEIGMTNTDFKSIDEFDDLYAKHEYKVAKEAGYSDKDAVALCALHGRDNARTPMLWSDEDNAGFTTGTPWLRVHQDYKKLNVKLQLQDESSTLNFYKSLIAIKHNDKYKECLTYGDFVAFDANNDNVIAFIRKSKDMSILVVANFDDSDVQIKASASELILASDANNVITNDAVVVCAGSCAMVILK